LSQAGIAAWALAAPNGDAIGSRASTFIAPSVYFRLTEGVRQQKTGRDWPGRFLKGSCTMSHHRRLLLRIVVIIRIRVKIILIWK